MKTNKILIVVLVAILAIAIGGYYYPKVSDSLGGNPLNATGPVHYQTETFNQGLVVLNGTQNGTNWVETTVGGPLATGVTYGAWQNTTNGIVLANDAAYGFSGTASSSFRFVLMATTTNPANFVTSQAFSAANSYATSTLIAGTTYATSTVASTTPARAGNGVIAISPGAWLVFFVQRGDTNCVNLPTVNGCEAATSTNRGIVPFWIAHLMR